MNAKEIFKLCRKAFSADPIIDLAILLNKNGITEENLNSLFREDKEANYLPDPQKNELLNDIRDIERSPKTRFRGSFD